MKLMHTTDGHLVLIALVLPVLLSVPAEAQVVDWPCSHSIETEQQVDIPACALRLISTWQECGRVAESSSEEDDPSSFYGQRLFLHLHRGIALIGFVVCATTEFVFDLLEDTVGNSN